MSCSLNGDFGGTSKRAGRFIKFIYLCFQTTEPSNGWVKEGDTIIEWMKFILWCVVGYHYKN